MMIPSRHGGAESDDGPKATTDTHFRMHTPRPPPHRNQWTENRGAFETPQLKEELHAAAAPIGVLSEESWTRPTHVN